MYKILVKYTKKDRLKFISHLELIKVVERAFRRAEIPLKFSQGFNPHPKIAFAAPLSVGVSSDGEYLTLEVNEEISIEEFKDKLNKELPKGISFLKAKYIDPKSKALMSIVGYASYVVKLECEERYDQDEINNRLQKFLSNSEIIHEKKGKRNKVKNVNIRELIKEMSILSIDDKEIIIKITVSTGSKGNLKPETAIKKFTEMEDIKINPDKLRVHRLEIFLSEEGNKLIPLDEIN